MRRKSQDATVASGTMFMAGIYDVVKTDEGEEMAFVIITTGSCDEFSWLHHRQPCFLDTQKDIEDWINVGNVPAEDAVSRILCGSEGMTWRRMVKDLSKESENQKKPKAQRSITSFFAAKGSPSPDRKKGGNPSTGSSARLGAKLGVAKSSGMVRKTSKTGRSTSGKGKGSSETIKKNFFK